ncbi:MAG TPA: PEP-CTERM sorting domain-containing protein [Fimbriimonadaceae bacterium]|nr:PEP-CTERM sorting domain-containing protein [Fimbriimonadaceae bacterium]
MLKIAFAGGLIAGSVAAHATWYTSEASFVAAIDPTYYLEDFSNFSPGSPLNGSQPTWAAPGANGYGWTASAVGNLYSLTHAIIPFGAGQTLTITFTGNPVTAFGGYVGGIVPPGNFVADTETMTLSNGESQSITTTSSGDGFLGWVGSAPITSLDLNVSNSSTWIQLRHAYTGSAPVPEPASLAVLGLGAIVLIRRKRK